MYLILIDAYSKWIEATRMSSTTSSKTIEVLRVWFSRYGLPERLVSDNGPQFTSGEFKLFCKMNGIEHKLVPPYHASSNGAAERAVQVVKAGLVKHVIENKRGTPSQRLAHYLLMYRVTPHSTTGVSPSELFMKRKLRTRFSLLKPDLSNHVRGKQLKSCQDHDKNVKLREFKVSDLVRVNNFRGGKEKWLTGVVVKVCGPRSYVVKIGEVSRYVHVDHLIRREKSGDSDNSSQAFDQPSFLPSPSFVPSVPAPVLPDPPMSHPEPSVQPRATEKEPGTSHTQGAIVNTNESQFQPNLLPLQPDVNTGETRYPSRVRKPPERLSYT